MIVFRVDGNGEIGSGHVMRCLSLADAFLEKGFQSTFIIAEKQFRSLIQERGFHCIVLNSAYNKLENELCELIQLLKKMKPEMLILDSYFVSPRYMNILKKEWTLVYIDDLNMFDYPSDIVVNYNIYADKMQYPQNKSYLLGSQYAPLRKEFNGVNRESVSIVKNVLFSTGGTDLEHIALRCISYLKEHIELQTLTYHFVIGAVNLDEAEIEKEANNSPYIKLHKQVKDMKSLMALCDIAVSAGGTTLYELCACRVPTVTYILADNQIMLARGFEKEGIMLCAGDVREKNDFEETLFKKLRTLCDDVNLRIKLTEKMQNLLDGHGAAHLASKLLMYLQ